MNRLDDINNREESLWVDQEVDGNMWRFYYKQIQGQWVKYTKIKLLSGGINLFH
jgi:hypothetical protein